MVEASADGIVAVDERGIIRLANPAAEMLFARSTGDLVGSTLGARRLSTKPARST
ncbi:PAS domain-containing protein [Saccharopolyspora shandongensis]|uniref:PAS domain-containing protein n=1 Tax=Saccharopolyspora shandongensis TaxID=418495 RepID=UPI0033DB65D6